MLQYSFHNTRVYIDLVTNAIIAVMPQFNRPAPRNGANICKDAKATWLVHEIADRSVVRESINMLFLTEQGIAMN
jgi:hypothetical protein